MDRVQFYFLRFSYHKIALCTTQCSAVQCGSLPLAVRLLHFVGSFSRFECGRAV